MSIPVSPHIAYSSRKKNAPQRKEKRKIRKNNDTSFASDVEISSVYHDINWPATPSSGAHKNINANIFVARGEAASITSTLVRGEKKKEANVRKESKEDSTEEKKNFILSLLKEEKKEFLLRDKIKNTNDIKIEKEVSMDVFMCMSREEKQIFLARDRQKDISSPCSRVNQNEGKNGGGSLTQCESKRKK